MKYLFWITVPEVSIHDQLASLFGPEVRLNSMTGRECGEENYTPHGSQEAESEKGRGRGRDKMYPSKLCPSD
jgi:hypothetical protein